MKIPDTASSYSLGWVEDGEPHWDADRARVFASVSAEMFPAGLRVDGRALPGIWWRVTDGGDAVAYGWLHLVSGRAVALLVVADTALDSGAPGFGLIRLGQEASSRGFDRVVEMRRRKHPARAWVTTWILEPAGAGAKIRRE
ncbi:MAG: hypothetical protein QOJ68_1257 [Blastococcus sp.]|jgi:hypothetical protein|nr:hypothetical protein [Blastococcus sp.]